MRANTFFQRKFFFLFQIVLILQILKIKIKNQLIILNPVCKFKPLHLPEYSEISEYQFVKRKDFKFKSEIFLRLDKAYRGIKLNTSFPETEKLSSQKIKLINPSKRFPNHPRTIYFENDEKINPKLNLTDLTVDDVIINETKYMCVFKAFQNPTSCITGPLIYNNIIKTVSYKDPNLIYRLLRKKERIQITKSMNKYQRYNHFTFCAHLHNKSILYQRFSEMQQKFPDDYNYMPKTFQLPLSSEDFEKYFAEYSPSPNNLWIIKPSTKSRGRGISLLERWQDIPDEGLLSQYVYNPLLVEGRKFDLRIYVCVTGFSPLKIYLFNNGLARFAGEQYHIDLNNLGNNFIHLTNYAINKQSKNWEFNDSIDQEKGLKWTIYTVMKHLRGLGIDVKSIWSKIEDILIKLFISYIKEALVEFKKFKVTSNNLFELFGIDILIDQNLRPWLMEVNMNPSLNSDSGLDLKLKSHLLTDIYNIIGLVPYSHDDLKESMDYSPSFESELQENIYETFCEFERPTGNFTRIFPLKENIDKYKKFFEVNSIENEKVWELMKKFNY
ncbi:MAG: tubulin--tyrosine ligase family protein [archaeon]|nr:tubulin--tyrosine ligase family protein [archaeon]